MALQLTQDEQALVAKAAAYDSLKRTEGYKHLLDYLEQAGDAALAQLRACQSSDPQVSYALKLHWASIEDVLKGVQVEVEGTISQRDELLRSIMAGRDEAEVESFLEQIRIGGT